MTSDGKRGMDHGNLAEVSEIMATQTRTSKQPVKRGKKAAEPDKPSGGPWLTREEAAVYLRLAVKTMDNWRACRKPGRPLSHNIGGKILYKQSDLDAYIERQREEA